MSDIKERIKLAKFYGFAFYRKAKGNHQIWINSKGKKILLTLNGSGDRRAIDNFKAQLRKITTN